MRIELYQLALIGLGATAAALFGVFLHREIFPEYKIYQNDYVALEKFRSTYTGEPPPAFKEEVKQILIERDDKGPPVIDRCISCHVALQFPHFSPTKIARDINGNVVLDSEGTPVQITNPDYIWEKLDQKIAELTDTKVIEQLQQQGNSSEANARLKQADSLAQLKVAEVGEYKYDVTKVLAMHPLIGKETRPFEFHSVDEYGCVSCHSGNGRGLTTEKAHGPVFDEQYATEFMGPKPKFTETDKENDPAFSRMFNEKPGHELLFQTTPILIGPLIQAKCVQCHLSSQSALENSVHSATVVTKNRENRAKAIRKAFITEKDALGTLMLLKISIETKGLQNTLATVKQRSQDYTLSPTEFDESNAQYKFLSKEKQDEQHVLTVLSKQIDNMLGSSALSGKLQKNIAENSDKNQPVSIVIDKFINEHRDKPEATGSLFKKAATWNLDEELIRHIQDTSTSLKKTVNDQQFVTSVVSDIDFLTKNYQHGRQLFISQGCYACHRITGLARGGVGPELTRIGDSYPWYIKESIVWPQADLSTSTMPNEKLDHEELQDIMTFLLAQKGPNKAVGESAYKIANQEWEAGRKQPWENPITPAQIHDLRYSMTVFATEGCAACHRLKGYESNVGYRVEKDNKPDFDALYKEHEWFTRLFPENIEGSQIVDAINKNANDIDKHISDDVRKDSIIEEIENQFPGSIEALYTPFKFALRAKNQHYSELIAHESDPDKKETLLKELNGWKERVKRIMMVYIQEYGLGRLICPRPNWSGVFRTDEWLMEHFRNPSAHTPRSLMPIMPFDNSKFYALTYMLDVLGIRNRDAVRAIWEHNGFSPELAFEIHCSQCHGEQRAGNGPVAEWIYPVPKNLRNADFLRNLTKENAIQSITHGVKGTPMPPWGEVAKDKPMSDGIPVLTKDEIAALVNWLFSAVPGERVIKGTSDVPKWQYTPKDVLQELQSEGNKLKSGTRQVEQTEDPLTPATMNPEPSAIPPALSALSNGSGYYASLNPVVSRTTSSADSKASQTISDVFDIVPNPFNGTHSENFYIKKKFYTEENIQQGKEFFELNCAVCHGNEADGAGVRAGIMQESKPRMLINLDWINTRDDLRLLRSIKYGVPGTAMTPWGDLTSSLQRMQLVIFIRSLTLDRERREGILSTVYKAFETALLNIDNARIEEYIALDKLQRLYQSEQLKQTALEGQVQQGLATPEAAAEIYKNEFKLLNQISQQQAIDQLFINLKEEVKREMDLYQNLGLDLIAKVEDEKVIKSFINLIALNEGRYTVEKGELAIHIDANKEQQAVELDREINKYFSERIASLQKEKQLAEGKLPSPQRTNEVTRLNPEIATMIKLKNKFATDLEEAKRSRQKQIVLFQQLKEKRTGQVDG